MTTLVFTLLVLVMAAMQVLIGGAKLVYSLPAYTLLAVAGIAAIRLPQQKSAGKPVAVCLATAGILAGYVVWRSQTSPVNYLARSDFYLIIGALLIYLVTTVHLTSPRLRLALVWALLGLATIHVGVGVVQFKEKQNYMLLPWIFRSDYGYRASGFYICPNHLAGLLEMLGLMALSLTIWGRAKIWVRVLTGYAAAAALVGLAITGSRGGYLSMVAGFGTFTVITLIAIWHLQRRWFWMLLLLSIAGYAGLLCTSVWVMSKSADLERRLGQVYEPKNMRLFMWKAAIETYKQSPWIGTGSGSYLFYGRHFRDHAVQNDPQHVHNDYLELLAEYGIAGSVLVALFLGAHFAAGLSGLKGVVSHKLKPLYLVRSNELALLIGTLSALAALTVHSVIDFNLHIPANALLTAFLFGILANPRAGTSEEHLRGRVEGLALRLASPLLGATLIGFAAPRIAGEFHGERARVCLRDQANADAIQHAERALRWDPKNPNLYYYLGEAKHNLAMLERDPAAQFKLHAEAASAFLGGLNQFSMDLQILLKLGRTLDNMRGFKEAELIFRQALQADPNFGNVYAYYGYHYYLQHRLLRAEKLYRKAGELGELEISPLGLKDIQIYRALASDEDTGDDFPIEDEPGDDVWEPGEP